MTPRWPLHPQPGPLEALSSWLTRIADLYHLSVAELLTGNLGLAPARHQSSGALLGARR